MVGVRQACVVRGVSLRGGLRPPFLLPVDCCGGWAVSMKRNRRFVSLPSRNETNRLSSDRQILACVLAVHPTGNAILACPVPAGRNRLFSAQSGPRKNCRPNGRGPDDRSGCSRLWGQILHRPNRCRSATPASLCGYAPIIDLPWPM